MRSSKIVIAVVIGLTLLLAGVVVSGMWKQEQLPQPSTGAADKEEVLRHAKEFQPEGACITVITPARHKATGAEYTFSSGCIPPGWEAVQSPDAL